ncbi:outer membrane protein assembly factor BamB family protein [Halococcus salifodinae]|uniref:outer membrane protein assembly factor BamB family protein n=1 Tax=Halococcus salifodinae TaxID=36738 RepID=UPI0013758B2D|nr:PQQ-binding-like beta-propeller repeat protein [Halococcus salifodinae]
MPASVSVIDGTVYVCGSQDSGELSVLRAIDARAGEEQWWHTVRRGNVSPPTIIDNTIYIASGNVMQAVDLRSRQERWHFEPDTPSPPAARIAAAPRFDSGTLYFGSTDGIVYALDAATGEKRWQFAGVARNPHRSADDPYASRFRGAVAVADNTVFAGSDDRHLYALDGATGEKRWQFSGDDRLDRAPTVGTEIVYASGSNAKLYALSSVDGTVRWTFDRGTGIEASPALANGSVYVPTGDSLESLSLYALNAATGRVEWKAPIGIPESGPCIAGGTIYIGDQSGLLALDTATGEDQWYVETGNGIYSSAAIIDGAVYVTDNEGAVFGLW